MATNNETDENGGENEYELISRTNRKWRESSGELEGDDICAEVEVRAKGTNLRQVYTLRNIFDFGFQVLQKDVDSLANLELDQWLNINVEVIDTWESDVESIVQKGVVKDAKSGEGVEYTMWRKGATKTLEEGEMYNLNGVVVNEFNDEKYLSVNSATDINRYNADVEEFDEQAREHVRNNSPISTNIRL